MQPGSPDLERARTTYRESRAIWFAGGVLEAHERLAAVTVAAGLRDFAFLNHMTGATRERACELLSTLGFAARPCNVRFDLDVKAPGLSDPAVNAYNAYQRRHQRFLGIGLWPTATPKPMAALSITSLGAALGYPACCVRMDVNTKCRDHGSRLRALVAEVGDRADTVRRGLRSHLRLPGATPPACRQWERRFVRTMDRFPFALHTACDECLKSPKSATAKLSETYESLAKHVSEELHFLVRWAAHIIAERRA